MKIVFMGTPDFAAVGLEKIINSKHKVVGVFTQPDKKRGRKQVLTPPEAKSCAINHNIPVFQPEKLKDGEALEIIKNLAPDVIVVIAYGRILPKSIIDYPKFGCINVHASLLPKYRGAAPIQWAVINGDKTTGVCTMQMDEGLDTGDIILCEKTDIGENETSSELFDRLSVIGGDLIVKTLDMLEQGDITHTKQEISNSTYASMLDKSICEIDWNKSAQSVHNLVRGLNDWPVAYTIYEGKKLKIYKTRLNDMCGAPGTVLSLSPLTIACSDKSVEIHEVQLEGKKRMDYKAFLAGHDISKNTIL